MIFQDPLCPNILVVTLSLSLCLSLSLSLSLSFSPYMSRPLPQPSFIWKGIEGGVASLATVEYCGIPCIAVGSREGSLDFYDEDTKLLVKRIYNDSSKRSIVSCGVWNSSIFVHIRNYGIRLFKDKEEDTNGRLLCATAHFGYAAAKSSEGVLLIPHMKGSLHGIIRYSEAEERNEIWFNETKSTPMCFELRDGTIFVGWDCGKVSMCTKKGLLLTELSVTSDPIFTLVHNGTNLFAGSSKSPIYIISTKEESMENTGSIPYLESAGGCSCVCVSPSGRSLFSSFWNGSVRAFSTRTNQLMLSLSICQSQSINTIICPRDKVIYTGDATGTVTLWKL